MVFAYLRKLFWQTINYFRPGETAAARPSSIPAPPPPPPPAAPIPDRVPLLAMDIVPPPEPRENRHARRSRDAKRRLLERARRRHDKFVTPQGPEPVKRERAEPTPAAAEIAHEPIADAPVDDPNDCIIADEWLEGDGELVLYEESEFLGEFNFRDSILDQLDRYWIYLERMRRYDPDSYGFYKQVGAILLPYVRTHSMGLKPRPLSRVDDLRAYKQKIRLTPFFKQHWPAFGCCAIGTNPRDETRETIQLDDGGYIASPKFLYFRRIEKFPWTVQPVRGGKFYVMTVWWDRVADVGRSHVKWGRPQEFPIHISDDGEKIRILKTRDRGGGKVGADWDWRIPHEYKDWSKQYGLDPQLHLTHIFCDLVRDVEYAQYSMLRVEVSNGDLTAVFGLNARRTPYFFRDRDIVLTKNGVKRPIFHMVRPFVDKRGVYHPTQFRGLRDFTWAGYRVFISVPGRDHALPLQFDVPATVGSSRLRKGEIGEPELGARIKSALHGVTP